MSLIKTSKKNKIIVSVLALLLIIFGYYLAIYKSFSYQSSNQTIGNVMILSCISLFPMLWLNISENSRWKKYIYVIPMVIIGSGIAIGIMIKRKNYLKEELNKYGINTAGIVTGFEVEHHRRSKTDYATFKYEFENRQFIQRIENYDDEYKLNQSLNIRISKRSPEMFEIIENKN